MTNQSGNYHKNFKIAGVSVSLETDFLFDYENLRSFEVTSAETADLKITSSHKDLSDMPTSFGSSVFSSAYMDVFEANDIVRFYYKHSPDLHYCQYDTICHNAEIVILNEPLSNRGFKDFTFEDHFFFAVRDIFFYYCQQRRMITLHSSSIIYNGLAYLFSAPSGTGKSTHTNLWEEHCNVQPLNGDVALLSVEGDTVYAHGMPWCGTSEKYSNETVPLGKIFFLKRASLNKITEMNSFEAVLNICSRSFSPNWNKTLSARTLDVAKEIERLSPCLLLECLPAREAMDTVKEYIDK